MDFLTYIDKMGVDKLADKLGTSSPSVYQWKTLQTAPRPVMAFKIIQLTEGLLDFNDIYTPYVRGKIQAVDPKQGRLI